MWSKKFWKAATERMVRGAAIAVAAAYFAGAQTGFDPTSTDTWVNVLALAVTGAVGSLALSLAGQTLTGNGPALTNNEELTPPVE